MRIFSREFGHEWSWGLVAGVLARTLPDMGFHRTVPGQDGVAREDILLVQQVNLLQGLPKETWRRAVCRLGGNRTFEGGQMYDKEMAGCFAIVATNSKLLELARKANRRAVLIPNGLDLDQWAVLPPRVGRFRAGFAGNIRKPAYREYKGYDYALMGCRQAEVPLETALYGHGQLPHDKMRELFFSEIDVLVHPTAGEGCSNIIMEALACGKPVVTTRAAGYHGERLEHGRNVVFCERTPESVRNAVTFLKNEPEFAARIGARGRKFAEEHHDIRAIAEEYRKLFNKCAAHQRTLELAGGLVGCAALPEGSEVRIPEGTIEELRTLLPLLGED